MFRNSKGFILVGVAFLIPMMMLCGSLVVDYGNWKAQESRLQNAADASVLAGAWYLDEDDSTVYGIVEDYVDANTKSVLYKSLNRVEENTLPNSTEVINVKMDQTGDTELKVTLLTRTPTTFLHYFGFTGLPIEVSATAQVSSGAEFTDEMFGFAMCAAHNTSDNGNKDYDMRNTWQYANEYAIYFHTDNVEVTGNIMANGKILFDQAHNSTLHGKVFADKDLLKTGKSFTDEHWEGSTIYRESVGTSVWGKYDWNSGEKTTYTFVDDNGNPFVSQETVKSYKENGQNIVETKEYDRSDKVSYRDEIDISVANNSGIKAYLENLKNMTVKTRESQHIYYDDDSSHTYYNFSSSRDTSSFPNLSLGDGGYGLVTDEDTSVPRWNRWYRTVVVPKDVQVSFEGSPDPTDDDFAVVVSLDGNIHIPNNVTYNGILYAPNGTVQIDGTAHVSGSIVAQKILITTPGQTVTTHSTMTHRSSSSKSTGKSVRLVS